MDFQDLNIQDLIEIDEQNKKEYDATIHLPEDKLRDDGVLELLLDETIKMKVYIHKKRHFRLF